LRSRQLCGIKFKRQVPVKAYILDFYSPEYGLGIEADGGQHYNCTMQEKDAIRSENLKPLGIRILRFSDRDILLNIEGVCEKILKVVENAKTPHPCPLP